MGQTGQIYHSLIVGVKFLHRLHDAGQHDLLVMPADQQLHDLQVNLSRCLLVGFLLGDLDAAYSLT